VGFLADDPGRSLRQELYANLEEYLADLSAPEVGPTRCDLLLLPHGLKQALQAVRRATPRPEATCAVVLTSEAGEPDFDQMVDLAHELSAWGVAVVSLSTPQRAGWFKELITMLSHDQPLEEALDGASSATGAGHVWKVGAEDFFEQARLSEALGALGEQMMATANGGTVDLPHETARALDLPQAAPAGAVAERIRDVDMSFIHERGGATHGARAARAARPMFEEAERGEAATRFILATVTDRERDRSLRAGFRAGGSHDINVWIGPKDREAIAGNVAFPDADLPPDRNGHRLTVVFTEPDLLAEPLVETIELPTVGKSGAARFRLDVPAESKGVEARISILHRGRILQTALLRGPVLEGAKLESDQRGIEILIEAILRPGFGGLDDRQRFDAAVILNHRRDGRLLATLLGRRRRALLSFAGAEKASTAVRSVFYDAERDNAFNRKLDSKESLAYLRRLAAQGTLLYDAIGKEIEAVHSGKGRPMPYLQILSANPNSFLPVELIYDLPSPSEDATLCPNAAKALEDGTCDGVPHQLDHKRHLTVVCPSGFWGVTKVIERHAIDPNRVAEDPEARGIDYLAVTNPIGDRKTLNAVAPLLFAASEHVNDVDPKELGRVTKALRALMGDKKVLEVDTWDDWVTRVGGDDPPMLLLLSHTAPDPRGAALEISKKDAQQLAFVPDINEAYVNVNASRVGPIVLLLGCDTSVVPQEDFQSFVAQFKEKGASLVVGTISPILGRHAGRVAEALIEELRSIGSTAGHGSKGVPFGAVMRQIRRNLMAKGVLIAMALTSYGDADWRLAPPT
jgi:hypothetical protein